MKNESAFPLIAELERLRSSNIELMKHLDLSDAALSGCSHDLRQAKCVISTLKKALEDIVVDCEQYGDRGQSWEYANNALSDYARMKGGAG